MQNPMRVLIATGLYPPQIGGPATHTRILEEECKARCVETVVVPFSRVRSLPPLVRHIAYFFMLLMHVRGASVIYALDPVSVGMPALCVSKITGKRFVLRVAGDFAWEQATQRFGVTANLDEFVASPASWPLRARVLMRCEAFVARNAERVIVPSEYLKRIVIAWGIPKDSITVVYNTFTPPEINETREGLRDQFGYSGPVLFSAGRLVPWKGFRVLIDIVAELKATHPTLRLHIAGSGPDQETLIAHAKERGVSETITFLGNVPHEELLRRIAGADLFVLNTGYEGFSHQLVEVMGLRVPIVTTPRGGNPEILEHEKDGLLVPYDDTLAFRNAIIRLLDEPEFGQRLAASAFERASSYTVTRMVDGVLSVLFGTTA